MPPPKKQPIRMCIQCRKRFTKEMLLRLQCSENRIMTYSGFGRSFYVCGACKQQEAVIKQLRGRCNVPKNSVEEFTQKLRETLTNG